MPITSTDLTILSGLVSAHLVILLAPGANQLSICCASARCVRAGLWTAATLTAIVAGLSSLAVLFGSAIGSGGVPVRPIAAVGAFYLAFLGARRFLAAWRNRPPAMAGRGDWATVAATALTNPFTLVFYASVVVPVVGLRGTGGFGLLVVGAMTAVAGAVYAILALAFAAGCVRRALVDRQRWVDAVAGSCFVLLSLRMARTLAC